VVDGELVVEEQSTPDDGETGGGEGGAAMFSTGLDVVPV